jgi:hypothetical protein
MAMQRVIGRYLLECVVGQHHGLPCEGVGSVILEGRVPAYSQSLKKSICKLPCIFIKRA